MQIMKNADTSVVVTLPTQAALRNQLKALIHDLRHLHPDKIYGSYLDDLNTADRLSAIIGT